MRKALYFGAWLIALLAVLSPAQSYWQSRSQVSVGSAPTSCGATNITVLNQDEVSGGAWASNNVTAVNDAIADPNGVATSASTITSTSISTFGVSLSQDISGISTTGPWIVNGYAKFLVAPRWMLIILQDTTSFAGIGANYDVQNGIVGTLGSFLATTTCATLTPFGAGGWYKFSFAGTFNSAPAGSTNFIIYFEDADGSGVPTVGQSFGVWGLGS